MILGPELLPVVFHGVLHTAHFVHALKEVVEIWATVYMLVIKRRATIHRKKKTNL